MGRPKKKPNVYIAIEGLDGSGKSTLIKDLNTNGTLVVKEPSDEIKKLIESSTSMIGTKHLISEINADRFRLNDKLKKSGVNNIVSDRCFLSTLVYQMLTNDEIINYMNNLPKTFLFPNIIVVLKPSVETLIAHIESRGAIRTIFETKQALETLDNRLSIVFTILFKWFMDNNIQTRLIVYTKETYKQILREVLGCLNS